MLAIVFYKAVNMLGAVCLSSCCQVLQRRNGQTVYYHSFNIYNFAVV